MTTSRGPMIFEPRVKKSSVGIQTEPNGRPLATTCEEVRPGKVAFHNPCPGGGAQDRAQTTTDCLHLPAPAMGNKF